MAGFCVQVVNWSREGKAVRMVRDEVFIREQEVPVELEYDGLDPQGLHLLAVDAEGTPIATARLLPDGRIGRMAVRKPWRGHGVGRAMLELFEDLARERGIGRLVLDAQTRAIGFYQKLGFRVTGGEFMDAGIPHRGMLKELASNNS